MMKSGNFRFDTCHKRYQNTVKKDTVKKYVFFPFSEMQDYTDLNNFLKPKPISCFRKNQMTVEG